MKKGEESRQRLIECAAELFWKNGYSATGISEILKQTDLPKGSFYFYFKSKDDLATAVTEYYQKILLEQFQNSSQGNDWESFIEEIFDFLSERTNGQTFAGCPYAVMGMETALSKPAVASVFMEGLKKYFWGGNPPHSYIVVLSKIKLLKRSLKKKVLCNFPEWHSISITCN